MKQTYQILSAAFFACLLASAASADCEVEYKAKKDKPLRLEHGTLVTSGSCEKAEDKAKKELKEQGWTLLKVLSVSDI